MENWILSPPGLSVRIDVPLHNLQDRVQDQRLVLHYNESHWSVSLPPLRRQCHLLMGIPCLLTSLHGEDSRIENVLRKSELPLHDPDHNRASRNHHDVQLLGSDSKPQARVHDNRVWDLSLIHI